MTPIKLALTTAFFCLAANGAVAHAHLVNATPEANGTMKVAPAQVSIEFTEALEVSASSISVEDAQGGQVDNGDMHGDKVDDKRLIVGLKPLPAGTYKVIWSATATDAHRTKGAYTFKVTG